uniref:Uncharacterized protein n=1 Tax=Oryza nivara TaxID=4536 RepID=A0A0E0HU91_ORYNI
MGFSGACWRKGLVRDSPRQRLDGCGLAVAPCSADAGRDDGAGVPSESEGFGLRLWVWRLRVVWRVSWREGSIYRRGRSERQARGIVAKCSASLARAGGGTASALCGLGTAGFAGRGWRRVASRRCSGREREGEQESGSSGLGEPARDAAKAAAGPQAGAYQPCLSFASGNRGQRLLGRLGNDDLDLAR